MRARTRRAGHAVVVVAAAALACAPDFTPRSVIENLRVLAVVADPLELYPGSATTTLTLTARTVTGGGLPATPADLDGQRWTFCPFSLGASVGYACVAPACETPLGTTAAVSLTAVDLQARLQACYDALLASGGLPPSVPPGAGSGAVARLDLVFRYVASAGGVRREVVQLVPLLSQAPAVPNLPPVIQGVRICGTAVAASDFVTPPPVVPGCTLASGVDVPVEVILSADSAQAYRDAAGAHVEAPVVSFYTTQARFDFDRANGPDAQVKLQHEKIAGPGSAYLYAVARDLRGGETVVGPYQIAVAP